MTLEFPSSEPKIAILKWLWQNAKNMYDFGTGVYLGKKKIYFENIFPSLWALSRWLAAKVNDCDILSLYNIQVLLFRSKRYANRQTVN